MRTRAFCAAVVWLITAVGLGAVGTSDAGSTQSCSTFLLSGAGKVLVGHNLDDSIETPGFILVNPRGVPQTGPRYRDLFPFAPGTRQSPESLVDVTVRVDHLQRVRQGVPRRRHERGGLVRRRDDPARDRVPDGPGPEAALPPFLDPVPARQLRHGARGARQPVAGRSRGPLPVALLRRRPRGPGRRSSSSSTGGPSCARASDLPWKLLTNSTYAAALEQLPEFEGFGGGRTIELPADCQPDLRFVWAAARMRD